MASRPEVELCKHRPSPRLSGAPSRRPLLLEPAAATNSTMPIWTTTIAPDAEDDAVGDHRDDAYEAVVLVVLVLRKSVEIMKVLKIRDSEQER